MQVDHNTLSERRHAALWKWQWLGWRESTPAFKVSIALLCAMAAYLGIRVLLLR
jgi:hypothetical protein